MTITNLRALRNTLDVRLIKSSCFGNNFLIYDDTGEPALDEIHFGELARQATDPQFGIGADNFIVLQNCTSAELGAINDVHRYWDRLPQSGADYIFRMFEPDGAEALCCGNGLISIANYLSEQHGVEKARVMTEIPLARVNQTTIGYSQEKSYGWVNLGHPRRFPRDIRKLDPTDVWIGDIQTVNNLRIKFRDHDLHPYSPGTELYLSGHLIFTGEPHLVFLLDDEDSAIADFADAIFAKSDGVRGAGPLLKRRSGFGSWLVDHIGHYINTHYQERFPAGVNVNFARKDPGIPSIEYRCYERGVYKETLACGTGAVAVAYIVDHFYGLDGTGIKILPHRCRWFKPHAIMAVNNSERGWVLEGQPDVVAEIDFRYELQPGECNRLPRHRAALR